MNSSGRTQIQLGVGQWGSGAVGRGRGGEGVQEAFSQIAVAISYHYRKFFLCKKKVSPFFLFFYHSPFVDTSLNVQ
jgi:hypothetical protein